MGINIKTKKVRLSEGYAVIRQLTPLDQIQIAEVLGEKADDLRMINNSIIALSISEIVAPDYTKENYLKLDPENPHNYQLDKDGNKIPDPDKKGKFLLDKNFPNNYVLDMDKAIVTKFPPVLTSVNDIYERMSSVPLSDWNVITEYSIMLNEPNPSLLLK